MKVTGTHLWHVNTPGCDKFSTRYRLSCPAALGAIKVGKESSGCRFEADGFLPALPGLRKERETFDWGVPTNAEAAGASPAPRRATI